jgi:hypothetical protein
LTRFVLLHVDGIPLAPDTGELDPQRVEARNRVFGVALEPAAGIEPADFFFRETSQQSLAHTRAVGRIAVTDAGRHETDRVQPGEFLQVDDLVAVEDRQMNRLAELVSKEFQVTDRSGADVVVLEEA